MKTDWKRLGIAVAVPLAAGGLSALLTKDSMILFEAVNKPPLSPPMWLFPVVWSILYILMGVAVYLVWVSDKPKRKKRDRLCLLCHSARLQLRLEHNIFRDLRVPGGVNMAVHTLVFHTFDHDSVFFHRQKVGMAHDPVSAVGCLRWISELRCLYLKLKLRAPEAPSKH